MGNLLAPPPRRTGSPGRGCGPSSPLIFWNQIGELANLPMVLTDADGKVIFYNEPAAAVVSQPFEDAPLRCRTGSLPWQPATSRSPSSTVLWSSLSANDVPPTRSSPSAPGPAPCGE